MQVCIVTRSMYFESLVWNETINDTETVGVFEAYEDAKSFVESCSESEERRFKWEGNKYVSKMKAKKKMVTIVTYKIEQFQVQ